MATTKITSPDLFNLESLNTALKLPSGTTAQRPTSPSTGEWRYNTTTNLVEFWDGGAWRDLQSEDIPPTPSEHFNTVLWTGTGSAQTIEVGFQPDMIWYKARNQAYDHNIYDSTRGLNVFIRPNSDIAQYSASDQITGVTSTGFTLGTGNDGNQNGTTFVAWCWKANGGTTSAGSGTGGVSNVTNQVNSKAGFSITKWNEGSSSTSTVTHGLSQAPDLVITKKLNSAQSWMVWHEALSGTQYLRLQESDAVATSSNFFTALPDSTSVYLGAFQTESTSNTRIMYAFNSVAGYSSFGSYTGNGAITGPLVNTGFEPAMIIIKEYDGVDNWAIIDNKRSTTNPRQNWLRPNLDNAEFNNGVDSIIFLTNGFQIGGGSSASGFLNENGKNYIYIAFGSDASAAPTLADSFANKLWSGNGGTQSITGLGFSPSLAWIKSDDSSNLKHMWFDVIRSVQNFISSNSTAAQATSSTSLTSFDTDGFSLGSDAFVNDGGRTYVAWNWKANPVPTINTDGTIQSVVSANQAAGFSIVRYTGNATSGATVGHGLGLTPDVVIAKGLSGSASSWWVHHEDVSSNNVLELNSSNAEANYSSVFNNTNPTSTVVTLGSGDTNRNNETQILYCFASISGFSKIGTYTGSGSGSTQSVNTGFAASWVLIKDYNVGGSWWIQDTARGGAISLKANTDDAESTTNYVTFTSTGFDVTGGLNDSSSGSKFIYMAFKENPTLYPAAGYMSFLVIAGGGGGARYGAGASGGYRNSYANEPSGGNSSSEADISLSAGTYTITIGAGGNAGNRSAGSAGVNSTLSTIIANGGGEGVRWPNNTAQSTQNGGSGGGQDNDNSGTNSAGTTVATNDGKTQGTAGGALGYGSGSTYYGAGGGGAGVAGSSSTQGAGNPGAGGNGLSSSITGTSITRGGGGGGGNGAQASPKGVAGTGGGGEGTAWNNGETANGTNGTANTGGGGGAGMSGGSGVVILRLLTSEYSSSTTGSPTVTTDGDYTVLTYTGSGTYVHS